MDNQCMYYDWCTRTVHDHPSVVERVLNRTVSQAWLVVPVISVEERGTFLFEGRPLANVCYKKYPYPLVSLRTEVVASNGVVGLVT